MSDKNSLSSSASAFSKDFSSTKSTKVHGSLNVLQSGRLKTKLNPLENAKWAENLVSIVFQIGWDWLRADNYKEGIALTS